jgi:LPXTG-motif cell wall-anchored protein
MNRADQLVDRAADRLQEFADQAATEGGLKAKLAEPLADDAALLRRMKPSLIRARIKGEAPKDLPPSQGTVAPSAPLLGDRPKTGDEGPNPFLVIGLAFITGIVLAKVIDWRGHAHPRD